MSAEGGPRATGPRGERFKRIPRRVDERRGGLAVGQQGIRKESITRSGLDDPIARHRFEVETSVQRIFDVYIPEAVYGHPATGRFIVSLRALTEGATIYQAVEGDWRHEVEDVRVLRLSITIVDGAGSTLWEVDAIRERVRRSVLDYMIDLCESGAPPEEAVFFNDWSARGTLVRRLGGD